MYLEDGREIYESDKYPGFFIDADTGAFCDEYGNYVGGYSDNGDSPGIHNVFNEMERVWVTKSGSQYYPNRTITATISMPLVVAKRKGYKPSARYKSYEAKKNKNKKK